MESEFFPCGFLALRIEILTLCVCVCVCVVGVVWGSATPTRKERSLLTESTLNSRSAKKELITVFHIVLMVLAVFFFFTS